MCFSCICLVWMPFLPRRLFSVAFRIYSVAFIDHFRDVFHKPILLVVRFSRRSMAERNSIQQAIHLVREADKKTTNAFTKNFIQPPNLKTVPITIIDNSLNKMNGRVGALP